VDLALEVDPLGSVGTSCDVNSGLVSTFVRLPNGWHKSNKISELLHQILVPLHNVIIAMLHHQGIKLGIAN
jgi:hypothetical protein